VGAARDHRQALGHVAGGGHRVVVDPLDGRDQVRRRNAVEVLQPEAAHGLRHDVETAVGQAFRLAQHRAAADLVQLVQTTDFAGQ
jgi:hypothetical protein